MLLAAEGQKVESLVVLARSLLSLTTRDNGTEQVQGRTAVQALEPLSVSVVDKPLLFL